MKIVEGLMKQLIRNNDKSPIHNCIIHLNNPRKNISYKHAFGHMNGSGLEVHHNYRFRTGSITKTFTATIIMQLMEEDSLSLDDFFLDRLDQKAREFLQELLFYKGINYSKKITISNLLEHRSGLRDYFTNDRFLKEIMKFSLKNWQWRNIMEKYFEYKLNTKGVFLPGEGFYYSDTNYLLLAVLIEQLTKMPFHLALEKRILEPLSLNDTYLEFYQEDKSSIPIVFPFFGPKDLKKIRSSFDWGGGGLISSANDLDLFIRSLLSGRLFNRSTTLNLMTNFDNNSNLKKSRNIYGMGLQKKIIGGYNFIGHNSAYGGMMFYDLDSDLSIIFSTNQMSSQHKSEWLIKRLVEANK